MNMSELLKITSCKIIRIKDKTTGEVTKAFSVYQAEADYDEGLEHAGRESVGEFAGKEIDFALSKRLIADIKYAHANLGQDFIYIEPVYKRKAHNGNMVFELTDYKLFKVDKPQSTK